jgi:pimeloyl-ACP methyl ester carboxylesterase
MSAIAVIREGDGPEVLLVHGGASPSTTWGAIAHLSARWTLALVHRRGYPPSPSPPDGRQDFDVDAADLGSLLDARPHVVAHSYGVLGTLIAATRMPTRVRSLTLIEPPLYHLVPGDAEVARLERMGNAVLTNGLDTDPATLREFLRLAGTPEVADGPLPEEVARGVRRAHGGRLPGEARPAPSRVGWDAVHWRTARRPIRLGRLPPTPPPLIFAAGCPLGAQTPVISRGKPGNRD